MRIDAHEEYSCILISVANHVQVRYFLGGGSLLAVHAIEIPQQAALALIRLSANCSLGVRVEKRYDSCHTWL
jgi:hypothetical protein